MGNLYWKIRQYIKDWYFRKRYGNKETFIYYDKLTECYVHTNHLDEYSYDYEYLVSDLVLDGLCYSFKVDGDYSHEHHFKDVLQVAYANARTFEIENKEEYSKQELNLISKLIKFRLSELEEEARLGK